MSSESVNSGFVAVIPDSETVQPVAPPETALPEGPATPMEPAPPDPAPPITEGVKGIRAYADGNLVYDSRLDGYELMTLKATSGVNVGGTATITMPFGHPAYNYFIGYRSVITIFRDGNLRFRGRALYHEDNLLGHRTITCEGELCFLQDAIIRPYKFQDTPANIFRRLVRSYNGQVEGWKQFDIGPVDVEDPSGTITLESDEAETALQAIKKLIDRCGGYVTFYDTVRGTRAIRYQSSAGKKSNQVIEFGENLLDFVRSSKTTADFMTGLVPYGARDSETQQRLTIASVNDGKDYIVSEAVQAIRGTILGVAIWDDITDPENLLKTAREYLNEKTAFITSLKLTALDLSYLNQDIDSFIVGDLIQARSRHHGLDDTFQLSQMEEDFIHPEANSITLGKDVLLLTRSGVAGDRQGLSAIGVLQIQVNKTTQKQEDRIKKLEEYIWQQ